MLKLRYKPGRRGRILLAGILLTVISFGFISTNDKDFQIAKSLDIFVTLFREINLLYVDDKKPEDLIEAGINGMLESLDPYTTFIPEENVDEYKFMTTGKYGGIGALIRKAGNYTIISEPYEGFPAQKSGLIAGDTIIKIDDVSIKNMSIKDVSEMLKGKPNTSLSIQIRRYGEKDTIKKIFTREQVKIPNVPYFSLMDNNIGYILLSNFMKGAGKEVKEAFIELKTQGAESIILDLRSNPGGLLSEAVNVANIWIPKGQEIVSTKGKLNQWDKTYKTEDPAVDTTIPLAVIVNRGSASASEIVSGSLQDLDRAIIIGHKTFGKGLVQTTRPLSYNTHLKITTAKYYIPSGRCIQALDYSHRNEDGSVGHIPDSLISEYKTRKGRSVFDGGGIDPDIKIDIDLPGNITMALYRQNLIFDFATVYVSEYDQFTDVRSFEISDEIYDTFIEFLSNKEFEYATKSSEKLEELIKESKKESYYNLVESEFDILKEKLIGDKHKDLITFKDEIKGFLKDEIAGRYYYQKGRIEANLKGDKEIEKASEILSNKTTVLQILDGSFKGETAFALGKN